MEKNTDKERNSGFCIFVIVLNQVSMSISMGIPLSSLNSASPAITAFVNETYMHRYGVPSPHDDNKLIVVIAQSILAWGSLVGALLVQLVVKKCSRKGGVTLSHTLNLVSVIVMSPIAKYTLSYEALILGRLLNGISRGIGYSIVALLIAETSCHRQLAFFQGPYTYGVFIGTAIGVGLGHSEAFGTPSLWPWINVFSAMFSIVYLACWPCLPQTSAFHIKNGDKEKAMQSLRKLRVGGESILRKEMHKIENEIERDSRVHALSICTMMKIPRYRKQMVAVFLIMNCNQFIGTQGIFFYSDTLFREAGVPEEYVTYASIAIFLECIIPGAMAIFLVRRIGTRKLFLIGTSIALLGMILFSISTALSSTISVMRYIAIFALALFLFGNYLGVQITLFALPSELTTQTTRPTAIFYAGIGYWVIASVVGLVLPYSLSSWGAYAYIPFILTILMEIIYVAVAVPETFGKTIEEIQQGFEKKKKSPEASKFICQQYI